MNRTAVNSRRLAALAITLLAAAGCQREDPRVKNLTAGISRDSAKVLMEIPGSELPYSYLIEGEFIETFVVRAPGVEGPRDSLTRKQTTPIVLIGGQLAGWGWAFWDSVGAAKNIPVAPAQ